MSGKELEGKVAIVTGAGRGIGRGIALELAKAGADIVAVDTDRVDSRYNQYGTTDIGGYKEAVKIVKEIENLGRRAIAVGCDVTKNDEVDEMVKKALDKFGKIDILCNNAGVITATYVSDMKEEEWDFIMDVNAKGVFLCSKAVIPHMIDRKSGCIINVASVAGKKGAGGLAHYCASKFAAIGFTQALSLELAKYNINVNAICPGIVKTAMWTKCLTPFLKEPYEETIKRFIPLGRDQSPEDLGKLAVFLAANPNVTGQAINVCGGLEIHA